jgi:hypothetical protein
MIVEMSKKRSLFCNHIPKMQIQIPKMKKGLKLEGLNP